VENLSVDAAGRKQDGGRDAARFKRGSGGHGPRHCTEDMQFASSDKGVLDFEVTFNTSYHIELNGNSEQWCNHS
jgi:hypothetical protein